MQDRIISRQMACRQLFFRPMYLSNPYRFDNILGTLDSLFDRELASLNSRLNLQEDEKGNYFLEFALPGYKAGDVNIELDGRLLTISAKNARGERSTSVTVWADIDTAKVESKLEDGILHISLPRKESHKKRRIEVLGNTS